jgi:hypothetical protein
MTGFGAHAGSMYEPTPHQEIDGIVRYVEQQLDAIRAASIGLTEEQVRLRPCRSASPSAACSSTPPSACTA